jgi:hypothetical protein
LTRKLKSLIQNQTAEPSLPPGWVALQDPSSGMTYYANVRTLFLFQPYFFHSFHIHLFTISCQQQTTGESSWDPPQPVAPQPAPVAMNGHDAANATQPSAASAGVLKTQKVANKYGDGFVTSASNPKLAEQYGNVGTR